MFSNINKTLQRKELNSFNKNTFIVKLMDQKHHNILSRGFRRFILAINEPTLIKIHAILNQSMGSFT